MTTLRQRMIEDMLASGFAAAGLRGLSERTQEAYVLAVAQLARYYGKSPEEIVEEDLRRYFLYLTNEKKASRSTVTQALCAIKFLYQHTLHREWTILEFVRPPKERKLPVVLSVEEVQQVLGNLRHPRYVTCLSVIYACGLRLQEGVRLQVGDIDGSRKVIHVHSGKGNKDRLVPLPDPVLRLLRSYWASHRHAHWLFPSTPAHGQPLATATNPISDSSVQKAFRAALCTSGVHKPASVHTLRHSWATHLLENGVNLRQIQAWLGHNSPRTTALATLASPKRRLYPPDPSHRRCGIGGTESVDGSVHVVELAEIFRQYGPAYRARFGASMPASHQAAMRAIEQCRTEALGGHVFRCPDCATMLYSYHSCQNPYAFCESAGLPQMPAHGHAGLVGPANAFTSADAHLHVDLHAARGIARSGP